MTQPIKPRPLLWMPMLSLLTERNRQPEIMDQPGLPAEHHQRALAALSRINWISASAGILWGPIRRLAAAHPGRRLRVLDIATGGGDVPVRLYHRARRAGLDISFSGADISGFAVEQARGRARREAAEIEFFQLDALVQPVPNDFDVITSSLFLHHLQEADAVGLMRRMGAAARSLVLVNDLIRSRCGYLLAWLGTRFLSRSPVVHTDGLLSVRAAFTMSEARALAQQAGLGGATVSWHWPFRFLLEWRRDG